ncbi:Uncharacterised protein [Acinetobacter baumannii]|uniref:hypothetical protein n=2 Tax=Acinetobacter baumannii TaxID=470 RepID=UPI0002BAD165|nr:hypothetical protein [Acinetobacter baumannii]SSW86662.1 Uncharacterised protein [Klebsiella pneumoniae]EHT1072950.1 hypothetical protein [Acinetobacter baumannii]EJB8487125.1 hypothetical protein [Acinetobacter baumannii]EKV7756884.1 hypothetical protein [Acinetobacter baumannii]EKW7506870.1 hypothetical protein [Acinetobacter baumannii]
MKKTVAEIVIYSLSIGISLILAKVSKIAYVAICSALGWQKSYFISFILTILYAGFMGFIFSYVVEGLKDEENLEKIQKPLNMIIAVLFSLLIFGIQAFVDMS